MPPGARRWRWRLESGRFRLGFGFGSFKGCGVALPTEASAGRWSQKLNGKTLNYFYILNIYYDDLL